MKNNKDLRKRITPPFWQHDYHVLTGLKNVLIKITKYLKTRDNILVDYGCGYHPYKGILTPFCKKYIGVDIVANPYTTYIVKEEQKLPLKDNAADIVLSTQVLEHVANVNFYLGECRRILKMNGLLILSTHGIWPYHPFPDDYHRWTKIGLSKQLLKSGFKINDIVPILGPFATSTQYELLLIAEKMQRFGIFGRILMIPVCIIGNLYIGILNNLFPPTATSDASVYVLAARKK